MKRVIIILIVLTLAAVAIVAQRRGYWGSPGDAPPSIANTDAERKILATLDQMRQAETTHLSVPPSDGRLLRLLTESVNAQHAVEIGTSTGYSGLWLCLALESTGGKLTTFELDSGRAATARKQFEQAGVARMVTVIEGDAHENVRRLRGPVDVVFIDADKEGYVDYLDTVLPLVRPGGLILAHNVTAAMGNGYVKRVTADPALETVFYSDGGGLGVTLKKR